MKLEEIFDSLTSAQIAEWVRLRQEEHLQLDFKLASSADLTRADDQKNLSKALSGFANSDGGIVVWGVDARKDDQGIDAASGIMPIESVARFVSRLNELTGSSVSPMVGGVRHRAIITGGDAGCAISLIPSSDSGPHMAKASEDRYYKRSGSTFRRMEHFDVADMFGRRHRPVLAFHTSLVEGGSSGGGDMGTQYTGKVIFGVQNNGRGLAKSVYLSVHLSAGYEISTFGIDGNCHEGLPRIVHSGGRDVARYGGSSDVVVHPGIALDVGAIEVSSRRYNDGRIELPPSLIIDYQMAAEGSPLENGQRILSGDDIASVVFPRAYYVPWWERSGRSEAP